jgi:polyphosphate glucokinase
VPKARQQDDPPIPAPGTRLSGVALGIDVGGTGVKAATVDLEAGTLVSERVRMKTPQPATPEAVLETIRAVVTRIAEQAPFPDDAAAGCGLPGVVKYGRLETASNIDPAWTGAPAEQLLSEALGRQVLAINDADAAGIAEMTYGAGRGRDGTVLLLTLGTGIGSALFIDGRLVPNTEFGHLEFEGRDVETRLSGAARDRRDLSWKAWAKEFNVFLERLELYFSPDLFIFGGGVSKELAKFDPYLRSRAPRVAAQFLNSAGIMGAAYAAAAQRAGSSGAPEAPVVPGAPKLTEAAAGADAPQPPPATGGDRTGGEHTDEDAGAPA